MDRVLADKPAGVPLRDPDPEREGFIDYVARLHGRDLAPLHDLGAAASGAVILAPAPGPAVAAARYHWSALAGRRRLDDAPAPPADAEALHLAEVGLTLDWGETVRHTSPAPLVFERPDLAADARWRAWLAGLDRRQRLFGAGAAADHGTGADGAWRLLHREDAAVRCDRFGERCWFYWFAETPPAPADLDRVAEFTDLAGAPHWTVHWMRDRGRDPQARGRWSSGGDDVWEVAEHSLRYQVRQDRGLSPGLFLDQRRNRRWVLDHARGRRVLNLFAYTGGFGLCAARGGACEVVNVDVARRTLDWARDNFRLNGLGLEGNGVEFATVDARLFLAGCRKRGRAFDLIVCDPPSFGRSREGVWKIDRDLPALVRAAADVLAPGGDLLVSTNYEGWDRRALAAAVRRSLAGYSALGMEGLPPADWDFELPGEAPLLKALRVWQLAQGPVRAL